MKLFRRFNQHYQSNCHILSLIFFDQFLCIPSTQFTFRKSLRDISDLYTISLVLGLVQFEKMPIFKLFSDIDYNLSNPKFHKVFILFEKLLGH